LNIKLLEQYDFSQSVIERLQWNDKTKNVWLAGAFDKTANNGCRYYQFFLSDMTKIVIDEKEAYQGCRMAQLTVRHLDKEYQFVLSIENKSDIEFICRSISGYFYKYKGMSYRNIYETPEYQALFEKSRQQCLADDYLESTSKNLDFGYAVHIDAYGACEKAANNILYTKYYLQRCSLKHKDITVFSYESIYRIHNNVPTIIQHQDGQHYFLFKSDLYGLNVYHLETGDVFCYVPEGYQHSYQQIYGESFIIIDIHYDVHTNLIAYEGCYWAGTNDVMVGDFSNPMHFNPKLQSIHELLDPEYELYDDIDFKAWKSGALHVLVDQKNEEVLDVCKLF